MPTTFLHKTVGGTPWVSIISSDGAIEISGGAKMLVYLDQQNRRHDDRLREVLAAAGPELHHYVRAVLGEDRYQMFLHPAERLLPVVLDQAA